MKKTPSQSKRRTTEIRPLTLTSLRSTSGGKPLTTRPGDRTDIRPFE